MSQSYSVEPMISADRINQRIEALAADINAHFRDTDKLVVIGLLRGSFVFIADLARKLDLPVEIDFIEVSSYGMGMETSREVRVLKDLVRDSRRIRRRLWHRLRAAQPQPAIRRRGEDGGVSHAPASLASLAALSRSKSSPA